MLNGSRKEKRLSRILLKKEAFRIINLLRGKMRNTMIWKIYSSNQSPISINVIKILPVTVGNFLIDHLYEIKKKKPIVVYILNTIIKFYSSSLYNYIISPLHTHLFLEYRKSIAFLILWICVFHQALL